MQQIFKKFLWEALNEGFNTFFCKSTEKEKQTNNLYFRAITTKFKQSENVNNFSPPWKCFSLEGSQLSRSNSLFNMNEWINVDWGPVPMSKYRKHESIPDLEGKVLCDFWQIVATNFRFLQRHDKKILKKLTLVELLLPGAAAASAAVVSLARLAQYGLDCGQALAVSFRGRRRWDQFCILVKN